MKIINAPKLEPQHISLGELNNGDCFRFVDAGNYAFEGVFMKTDTNYTANNVRLSDGQVGLAAIQRRVIRVDAVVKVNGDLP